MGNYRLRLSDMMPNAWFYKLKDMSKSSRNHAISSSAPKNHYFHSSPPSKHTNLSLPRKSYYYDSHDPYRHGFKFHTCTTTAKTTTTSPPPITSDPPHSPGQPRKSRRRVSRKVSSNPSPNCKLVSSSISAGCRCRASLDNPADNISPWFSSSSCRVSSSPTAIIIDIDSKTSLPRKSNASDSVPELDLPPIQTKPAKFKKETEAGPFTKTCTEGVHQAKNTKTSSTNARESAAESRSLRGASKSTSSPPSFRLRTNSPRLASRKIQAYNHRKLTNSLPLATAATNAKMRRQQLRKSISDSFAVVKSSMDPQKDFRVSMVEMIVENNIRKSKDLEDLLACYLSLNSDEYHDVIVKVFQQIWFDLIRDTKL